MSRIWAIGSLLYLAVTAQGMSYSADLATNTSELPAEPAAVSAPVSSFPSELTVDGLISLSKANFPLQMGAFSRQANAETLRNRLIEMLGIEVNIVNEDGLYKVRINNLAEDSPFFYYIPVDFHEAGTEEKATGEIPVPEVPANDTLAEEVAVDTLRTPAETNKETVAVMESARRPFFSFLMLTGDSPWLKRYNYFGKSVALVNALIFTIVTCVTTMVILLIIILLNRNRMEKEAKLRQYLLEKYQGLIIDYLFGDANAELFKPIASDMYRRQVLIDQMIDVSINLKGETGQKLTQLYKELNLDSDSISRVHSRRWHIKIKGFRELAFMNIRDANDEIYKALNSRNEILRMEAQIALVRLSEKNPFEFLHHLRRPFSLWEQITLHELLIQHELPVPEFKEWLASPNPTVVMFALRMIREFRQKDAEPEVRKALLHYDTRVSQLAVQVAGDLDMRSTLETMKRMYKFQEYNNCLEIVRSMGKMPELAMMGFLKLVLDKEDDVQLQIEATKAIENMGEEGVKALVKIMKSEYKNYNIIVRHVLDRRIY